MERYYVGLDVHSRESVFVIKRHDGEVVARGALPTTAPGLARLRDEHGLPPGTPVALETGTSAFFVARELAGLDLAPVVIDAHEVRRKAHRPLQKSDRRDALELCEGLSRGFYQSVVHVPSPEIGELRTILSRRRHFIRIQVAEVNAVKRLLRGAGRASACQAAACGPMPTGSACSPPGTFPETSRTMSAITTRSGARPPSGCGRWISRSAQRRGHGDHARRPP